MVTILDQIHHPRALIYSSLTQCKLRRKSPPSISTRVCLNQFEYTQNKKTKTGFKDNGYMLKSVIIFIK